MRAAVGDARRADPVFRRRQGRRRKAAFRAIETALPLIGAGKSLRFALLPEGQDPDDLARPAGRRRSAKYLEARGRSPKCCSCAKPRSRRFETPEQRAALERRLRELAGDDRRRDAAPALRRRHGASASTTFFGDGRRAAGARPRSPRGGSGGHAARRFFDPGPRIGVAGRRCRRASSPRQAARAGARDHDSGDRCSAIPALLEAIAEDIAGDSNSPRRRLDRVPRRAARCAPRALRRRGRAGRRRWTRADTAGAASAF